MTLELVKIQESVGVSPVYYVLVDGQMIPSGWSGSLAEAEDLYQAIASDPSYLTTRQEVLQSTNI